MQFLWIPRVGQSVRLSIRCWYHVLSGCNITIDEDAKKAIKRYHCENIGVLFYILTVASFGVNDNSTSSDFCRLMTRLSPCLLESVTGDKLQLLDTHLFKGELRNDHNLKTLRDLGLSV